MRLTLPISSLLTRSALALALLPLLANAQSVPIGAAAQWLPLHDSQELKAEFEKSGVFTRGDFTYVAVRELEAAAPQAYTLSVLALRCKEQRLSVAALGTLSLDGSQVQHGKLNDEAKLVKYSVPVGLSQTPYAARLMQQACPR